MKNIFDTIKLLLLQHILICVYRFSGLCHSLFWKEFTKIFISLLHSIKFSLSELQIDVKRRLHDLLAPTRARSADSETRSRHFRRPDRAVPVW